jgi:hypothetical protein
VTIEKGNRRICLPEVIGAASRDSTAVKRKQFQSASIGHGIFQTQHISGHESERYNVVAVGWGGGKEIEHLVRTHEAGSQNTHIQSPGRYEILGFGGFVESVNLERASDNDGERGALARGDEMDAVEKKSGDVGVSKPTLLLPLPALDEVANGDVRGLIHVG